jgi:chromosome segregation ATPase
MTKHTTAAKIPVSLAILFIILFDTGCQRAKINTLNEELIQTEKERDNLQFDRDSLKFERDNLKSKLEEALAANEQLKKQLVLEQQKLQLKISELTSASEVEKLQAQKLSVENETMKGIVAELTKTKDTAANLVKESQLRITDLMNQLNAEKKKAAELESQLMKVQEAVKEFEAKVKS